MTATRILTAAVLIPVVVALVLYAPTFIVAIAAAMVMLLALLEFFAIGEQAGIQAFRIWTGLCAIAVFNTQMLAVDVQLAGMLGHPDEATRYAALERLLSIEHILMLFVFGCGLIVIVSGKPIAQSITGAAASVSAVLFIAFPLSTVIRIHGAETYGRKLLLFTLLLVWAGDTLAYFVGRWIGQMPLAPRISPKKTWEGAIANLAGSLLVGFAFMRWLNLPPRDVLLMAALANLAGQGGDLLESAYKRSVGVKDSGTILPGHGGMLDRIDALIFAAPVVWYYFSWLAIRGS
jgi:phosphatidate cytidylyltransferase